MRDHKELGYFSKGNDVHVTIFHIEGVTRKTQEVDVIIDENSQKQFSIKVFHSEQD